VASKVVTVRSAFCTLTPPVEMQSALVSAGMTFSTSSDSETSFSPD
jgi:hypothetical protein